MVVVTAAVLIVDIVGTMAEFVLNMHDGAALNGYAKVIVQAVAAIMPDICPLLSLDPVTSDPDPQVDTTGRDAGGANCTSPMNLAA